MESKHATVHHIRSINQQTFQRAPFKVKSFLSKAVLAVIIVVVGKGQSRANSAKLGINQSISQTVNQSINQSIDQSIDIPTYFSSDLSKLENSSKSC